MRQGGARGRGPGRPHPLSDQSRRLLYGDTLLFMEVVGGHVLRLAAGDRGPTPRLCVLLSDLRAAVQRMVSRHDRRDGELSDRCRRLSASRDDDDYERHKSEC